MKIQTSEDQVNQQLTLDEFQELIKDNVLHTGGEDKGNMEGTPLSLEQLNELLTRNQDALVTEESGGMKADGNKIRPELFPMETMLAISDVLTFGAEKYEDNNWKKVDPERYKGALLRHLAAIDMGETIDPDSGLPHIDHVACNAVFLSYLDYGSEK